MLLRDDLYDDLSEKVSYDYSDYPAYIRRDLLSSYPGYSAPSHWHDDIELIYILSGQMLYNVSGAVVALKAGEGILVNARQMHYGFSNSKEECDFLCVLLHPTLLCATEMFEREYVAPVLNRGSSYYHLASEAAWQQEACRLIQAIYQAKGQKMALLYIQQAFLELWALLLENAPLKSGPKNQENSELTTVKSMARYIQENYWQKVTMAEIARAGAVGKSKCCGLFQKYLRQTPGAYLTDYRLHKGMELLASTDKAISEIAGETGFGGASYFAEVFHRCMGMTPREYRRQQSGKSK